MDLALFKARYPQFTDDVAITTALDDAKVMLLSYNVPTAQTDLAIAYMTAHLLTVDKEADGIAEPQVKRAKADTVEVEFFQQDNGDNLKGWLITTKYGKLLLALLSGKSTGIGILVV